MNQGIMARGEPDSRNNMPQHAYQGSTNWNAIGHEAVDGRDIHGREHYSRQYSDNGHEDMRRQYSDNGYEDTRGSRASMQPPGDAPPHFSTNEYSRRSGPGTNSSYDDQRENYASYEHPRNEYNRQFAGDPLSGYAGPYYDLDTRE